ncbi:MAG: phage tail protein [Caldilineaceae bacterium]|nr:phage tail protein [Caldilineaceae bacterium]
MIGVLSRAVAWRFYVQVDGIIYGEFTECSGLEASREVTPFTEGGSLTPIMLPGRVSHSNIVLKRGIISSALWDWFTQGDKSGLPEHRSLIILLATTDGIPLYYWDVTGVYPVNWSGPQLSADGNSLAVESLELARGGSGDGEAGDDGDDGSDEEESNGLDIDKLSFLELNQVADRVITLLKRDTIIERERAGR